MRRSCQPQEAGRLVALRFAELDSRALSHRPEGDPPQERPRCVLFRAIPVPHDRDFPSLVSLRNRGWEPRGQGRARTPELTPFVSRQLGLDLGTP